MTYDNAIRKGIGLIGIALPVVLVSSHLVGFVPGAMPNSISGFYFTRMGPYFVGSLCAQAALFVCYRHTRFDNWLSNVTALVVTIVALCPTAPPGVDKSWWNWVHLAAAFAFFTLVAVFAGFRFTRKPGQEHWWDPWNSRWPTSSAADWRDWIYRCCALVIMGTLLGAFLLDQVGEHLLLWGEVLAMVAYSFSWLVKGQFRWLWRWEVLPDEQRETVTD